MKFFSLNQNSPTVDFKQALLAGLAPDGGLYFPESFPCFSPEEISDLKNNSLAEVGFKVLCKWLESEMEFSEIKKVAYEALNFPIPLRKVGEFFILELFYGPTMAFKDIAARSLALLMSRILQKENKKAVILVATSGDTGGAVAHGFGNVPNIKVVVLYPRGKVSKLMDIGNPSNFIRILKVFDNNHAAFKKLIRVVKVTDSETIAAIKKVYTEHNYLLDSHTAVAWVATENEKNDFTKIITGTASPVKFSDSIKKHTGIEVDDSQAIAELAKNSRRKIEIKNDYAELKSTLSSLPI